MRFGFLSLGFEMHHEEKSNYIVCVKAFIKSKYNIASEMEDMKSPTVFS